MAKQQYRQKKWKKKGVSGTTDTFMDNSKMTANQQFKLEKARIKQGNPAAIQKTLRHTAWANAATETAKANASARSASEKYGLSDLSDPMSEGTNQNQDKSTVDGYTPGNTGINW